MSKIEELEATVRKLYELKNPGREEWADWLYENHVFIVTDYAKQLASRFNANEDLARAAAMLHDVADVEMSRFDARHETRSLELARQLLQDAGFSEEAITLVADDAIRYHNCHAGDPVPASTEGKILASADALAHLQTDFYAYWIWAQASKKPLSDIKQSALQKMDRDYNRKLLFPELKNDAKADYEMLKDLFSR